MMKIGNITFDCADPDRVATFWAAAMGYTKAVYPDEMRRELLEAGLSEDDLAARAVAEDPSGQGPRLFFQRVPEPKSAKNRMHLDLNATPGRRASAEEIAAEVQRLEGLGATVSHEYSGSWGPWPEHHVVMADPEGNEFCVQ
ncbi:MAG: VOC family protein [Nitriliruptorales bacterium]|nr:VOC family protein [Nitriliruptorales bacterium]